MSLLILTLTSYYNYIYNGFNLNNPELLLLISINSIEFDYLFLFYCDYSIVFDKRLRICLNYYKNYELVIGS
jgi:hypothetical protein